MSAPRRIMPPAVVARERKAALRERESCYAMARNQLAGARAHPALRDRYVTRARWYQNLARGWLRYFRSLSD